MIELIQDQDQNQEWLIVIKIIITNIEKVMSNFIVGG